MEKKSPDAFRTISEVAEWLGVPTHVLRFWESRFSQVKPVKRAGGRRYYRPNDMELLGGIRKLLHEDGMTIRGVQKLLREEGIKHVAAMSPPLDSDEMRDITPSNVVPLASKSEPENKPAEITETDTVPAEEPTATTPGTDAADERTAPPAAAPASPTQDDGTDRPLAVDTSDADSPDPAASLKDDATPQAAHHSGEPQPDASEQLADDTSNDAADDAKEGRAEQPVLGDHRAGSEPESASEPETESEVSDDQTATAPELPGLHDTPESRPATGSPSPAPLTDISHVPADPGDGDALPAPALAAAVRQARKAGSNADIAALQALADRLETLAARMGAHRDRLP